MNTEQRQIAQLNPDDQLAQDLRLAQPHHEVATKFRSEQNDGSLEEHQNDRAGTPAVPVSALCQRQY